MSNLEKITGSEIRELIAGGATVNALFVETKKRGFTMEVECTEGKHTERFLLCAERGNIRYFRGCRSMINYPRRLGIKDVCFHFIHEHEIKI